MSHIMCRMSHVTCHKPCVTCPMSCVTCYIFLGQSCEPYWQRLCYQQGLPRLVLYHFECMFLRKVFNQSIFFVNFCFCFQKFFTLLLMTIPIKSHNLFQEQLEPEIEFFSVEQTKNGQSGTNLPLRIVKKKKKSAVLIFISFYSIEYKTQGFPSFFLCKSSIRGYPRPSSGRRLISLNC